VKWPDSQNWIVALLWMLWGAILGLMAAVLMTEWLCDQARATDDRIRWLTAVGGSPTVRHATSCAQPFTG